MIFLCLLTAKGLAPILWDVNFIQRFVLVGDGCVSDCLYTIRQHHRLLISGIFLFSLS